MRTLEDAEAVVRSLRQRVADLEYERDQWRDKYLAACEQGFVAGETAAVHRIFDLTPSQTKIILALYRGGGRPVTKETVATALYGDEHPEPTPRKSGRPDGKTYLRTYNSLETMLYRAKQRLRVSAPGVAVGTEWGFGWTLRDTEGEIEAELARLTDA